LAATGKKNPEARNRGKEIRKYRGKNLKMLGWVNHGRWHHAKTKERRA